MAFNPNDHMLDMRGKKYLPVAWRIVWFREANPGGTISTEVINFEPLCVKATIATAEGVLIATGHGTANDTGKAVWSGRAIEKAETAAIGRALGHAGFGTQFDADDEDDNLADGPVDTKRNPYNAAPKAPTAAAPASPVNATLDEAFQQVMKDADVVRMFPQPKDRAARWNAVKDTLPAELTITSAVQAMLATAA